MRLHGLLGTVLLLHSLSSASCTRCDPRYWTAVTAAGKLRGVLAGDSLVKFSQSQGDTISTGSPLVLTARVAQCSSADDKCSEEARAAKAEALATTLRSYVKATEGLLKFTVKYRGRRVKPGAKPATPNEAAALIKTALEGSAYFEKVVHSPPYEPYRMELFWVVCNPVVVQWPENQAESSCLPSDYAGQSSSTAAEAIADVFMLESYTANGTAVAATTKKCPEKGCFAEDPCQPTPCLMDPCTLNRCEGENESCNPNYCGGCNAECVLV